MKLKPRKKHILLGLGLLSFTLIITFGLFAWHSFSEENSINKWADQQLKVLTIEEKVGQLLLISSRYHSETEQALRLFKDKPLGGIITYGKSKEPQHLIHLKNALNQISRKNKRIPFWISMDHEGRGLLSYGTSFPRPIALENLQKSKSAYDMAFSIGNELKSLGVNLVYSPVLDVNLNPKNPIIGSRSFSSNPKIASKLAKAYIKGFLDSGVSPVGKHFPGHGRSASDSHLELPSININLKGLMKEDLKPFKSAIKAQLPGIMTAHVLYPEIDSKYPATLSKTILQFLLRKQLNFKGFVISDAMNMKGISDFSNLAQNVLNSIKAGVDICMLVDNSINEINEVYHYLLSAVANQNLSEERVNEAVKRILIAKKKARLYQLNQDLTLDNAQKVLKRESHLVLAEEIRKKSIRVDLKKEFHQEFSFKNKKVLLITDSISRYEAFNTASKILKPAIVSYYLIDQKLSEKARLKLWGKYLNFEKKNNKEKLASFYAGSALSEKHQKEILKRVLSYDVIFVDIQSRSLAESMNKLASEIKLPVIGLYFTRNLDNPFYYQFADSFSAHLTGFSQNQSGLALDIQDAFVQFKAKMDHKGLYLGPIYLDRGLIKRLF